MEKTLVTFDLYATNPVPPRLNPLVAFWWAPEPNATRLFVAKAELNGMRVFHDRRYDYGPIAADAVASLMQAVEDAVYERLVAFVGVQETFAVPPAPPSAEG